MYYHIDFYFVYKSKKHHQLQEMRLLFCIQIYEIDMAYNECDLSYKLTIDGYIDISINRYRYVDISINKPQMTD